MTPQERMSAIHVMLPFRVATMASNTGFQVANRQASALLYGGVTAIKYRRGAASPSLTNGAVAPRRI